MHDLAVRDGARFMERFAARISPQRFDVDSFVKQV
jgi:hypothetical protein